MKGSCLCPVNHDLSAVPLTSTAWLFNCVQAYFECDVVRGGCGGSVTQFTVTIHPEMDFAVLLSHVQRLKSLAGR